MFVCLASFNVQAQTVDPDDLAAPNRPTLQSLTAQPDSSDAGCRATKAVDPRFSKQAMVAELQKSMNSAEKDASGKITKFSLYGTTFTPIYAGKMLSGFTYDGKQVNFTSDDATTTSGGTTVFVRDERGEIQRTLIIDQRLVRQTKMSLMPETALTPARATAVIQMRKLQQDEADALLAIQRNGGVKSPRVASVAQNDFEQILTTKPCYQCDAELSVDLNWCTAGFAGGYKYFCVD